MPPACTASRTPAATHHRRRASSCVVIARRRSSVPTRPFTASPGFALRNQCSSPVWKLVRRRFASALSSSSGTARSGPAAVFGNGAARSGENSTLSDSSFSPRHARRSFSSGSRTIGMSLWPPCRRSR